MCSLCCCFQCLTDSPLQVWPTSPREFAVLSHWRLVRQNDSSPAALAYISFSCPTSESAVPVAPKHVRGKLLVSLYVLRPREAGGCRLTRLVSVHLGGSLSPHLSNIVTSQQAGLPGLLEDFMQQQPKGDDDPLSYATVRKLCLPLLITAPATAMEENDVSNSTAPPALEASDEAVDEIVVEPPPPTTTTSPVSLEQQALCLLAPVVISRIWYSYWGYGQGLVFALLLYLALRQWVLWSIPGPRVPSNHNWPTTITCHCMVEAKGIVRFVTNQQEEREMMGQETAPDVKAMHVVVCAVAKALRQRKEVRRRRVVRPWLCIDRRVDVSNEPVTVTVVQQEKNSTCGEDEVNGITTIETVRGAESLTVQQVATGMQPISSVSSTSNLGDCLILSMDTAEDDPPSAGNIPPLRFDATVCDNNNNNPHLVVCVSGLRNVKKVNGGFLGGSSNKRRMIMVGLTLRGGTPSSAPLLAREVQKLLQFPEMCDDDA